MRIKTKLTFGVGLLFCLIMLLAGSSVWYLSNLKRDTNNILKANYNSVEYANNMLAALEEMPNSEKFMAIFDSNLKKQLLNMTESKEEETTLELSNHLHSIATSANVDSVKSLIRMDITRLTRLNMGAIDFKSGVANQTAKDAILWVLFIGGSCFIIAFILLIKLPSNIANPVRELTESIKQIANQNYSQRLNFESHNEYGELARSFNTMAEKLEEYSNSRLEKILKDKKRVETLINNMHDAVIGVDENMIVLFANDEALKITGLEKQDVLNRSALNIAIYNDLIRTLIADIVNPSKKKDSSPLKIYADNKESYFEKDVIDIEITPTGEHASQLIGHVILLKNITSFKELDFAKTNFIATISHELKTPISSIKMSTQLLEHTETGSLNNGQKELIESIKEDSHRLLQITGELLNMSQVETGNIQLNIQKANSYDILRYAINTTKLQADQKHVTIKENIPKGPLFVMADLEKTAWVLTNLLTNAIRYSVKGREIIVTLQEREKNILFSVRDFGQGIDVCYQKKIFDRYFQIPGSNQSGTGLGLAIGKEFIETQGGYIDVESEQGIGSDFFFALPKA